MFSTLNFQLSTFNFQLSTLNFKLSTSTMSSSPAIIVENLSKQYVLGGEVDQSKTFREMLVGAFKQPVQRLKRLQGNSKAQETFWALKDISFEINEGEVVGIIGANGAGKSTLLKVLSRITAPTKGAVHIKGRIGSLLEVGAGFHPELTGKENIYVNGAILGMKRREVACKFEEIVEFAEVEKFIDTPVKRYSSGMYVRLAFSVAAHLESEILVVDEVLAVGDIAFQKKCLGKMEKASNSGRTILFVSHNMDVISKLCKKSLLIDGGALKEIGPTQCIINSYLDSMIDSKLGNIISLGEEKNSGVDVLRIEVLDNSGNKKEVIHTWDEVIFRIVIAAHEAQMNTSVVLQISTLNGSILHTCSTQPDRNTHVRLRDGINIVDCYFPRLLLSAGKYRIGAGVAIPNVSWLCSKLDRGVFVVEPSDVYGSGTSPDSSRYLIPVEYEWYVAE